MIGSVFEYPFNEKYKITMKSMMCLGEIDLC